MTTPDPTGRRLRPAVRRAGARRPVLAPAAALAAGALLATAACSGGDRDSAAAPDATATAERPPAPAATPSSTRSASAPTGLTAAGARQALITAGDIEENWTQARRPGTWRDSLLVGRVDVADLLTGKSDAAECQRLVDSLYDDTLLGRPSGASALTGFQQDDSRLLYQVAAYRGADLDRSLKWLGSLPVSCDQFTLTGGDGGKRSVQVVEASLPDEGEARRGLTVTVKGTSGGAPVTLTLDVAAVRFGTDAITVTNGGPGGAGHDSTRAAVGQGAQRLKAVRSGRTPTPTPTGID